jgi:glutamate-1-semialdehyde 2,1-aminomutase
MGAGAQLRDVRSAELYARALGRLPGGVNSPVRAMQAIGRTPIFIERAEGAELQDVDGNRYLDYVSSWGPLIHGHAHPRIVAAVTEAAARGTSYGAPTAGEVDLADEVASRMPSVEMLRMTSSGTEASMSAIRLARAATRRTKLLKFAGAYHGHLDGLLAQAGSGLLTAALPASPGVPPAATADTIIVDWNDGEGVVRACAEHEFAAILAEPYPANMGLIAPVEGFLELLRHQATESGALLIFDEVITGFRVARGGAQEREGVLPDLTVMGKVIGGGLPAAAYGGPRTLMEMIAPAGDVYQAGTLSGNPLAVAAGLATLAMLDEGAYLRLEATTRTLADGLAEAALAAAPEIPVTVTHAPGLLTVFFASEAPRDLAGAQACDLGAHAAWCRALLARGVYPPPSQFEAWFPSLAHGPEQVARTLELAEAAFREVGAIR